MAERERIVKVERRGLRVRWEAWLRGPSGGGPVLRGACWTRRGANRSALNAEVPRG